MKQVHLMKDWKEYHNQLAIKKKIQLIILTNKRTILTTDHRELKPWRIGVNYR